MYKLNMEHEKNKCVICSKEIDSCELCYDCAKENDPFDLDSNEHEYPSRTEV